MYRALIASSGLLLALLPGPLPCQDPVPVDGGKIAGVGLGPVRAWLGIPYAAPPVGDLRWRAPQPVNPWEGVRACTSHGPACPQPDYDTRKFWARAGNIPRSAQSEDCLYLNVWAPARVTDPASAPVLVWFHGGSWINGSGSEPQVDGTNLARRGAVVVTVNYRLNVFGFLAHPELSAESQHNASGNYGLMDQIAALRWVQRNIAAFGGDPGRVTAIGESAGAWSIAAMLCSPEAEGLFHRAIAQSGAIVDPLPRLQDGEAPHEQVGVQLGEELGAADIGALRGVPADRLLAAATRMPGGFDRITRVIVDGHVLPEDVCEVMARGEQRDIPLILGVNRDEWTALGALYPEADAANRTALETVFGQTANRVVSHYRTSPDMPLLQVRLAALRDLVFTAPVRQWARWSHRQESPVFLYHFTQQPDLHGDWNLGAYHTAEMGYVFDNLDRFTMRTVHRQDRALATLMADMWVRFAATGSPVPESAPDGWPPHTPGAEVHLDLGPTIAVHRDLRQQECDLMDRFRANR